MKDQRDAFLRPRAFSTARVLAKLDPPWPRRHVREALATAKAIRNDYNRVVVLAAFAPHMPEINRDTAVPDAIAAAETIPDDYARSRVLAALRVESAKRHP